MIENDQAQHNGPLHRLLSYVSFEGQEGVVGNTDCRVTEMDTPGGSVWVHPGAFAIINRALNSNFEAYANYIDEVVPVPVAQTDSSGSRSDMLIIRVENPEISGEPWLDPASPTEGPYNSFHIIQNVDPTAYRLVDQGTGWTGIPLCRIDIPANTATITQDMIQDLRSLIDMGGTRVTEVHIATNVYADNKAFIDHDTLPGSNDSFVDFPSSANWQVPVPTWATGVDIMCFYNAHTLGHVWGWSRIVFDGNNSVATTFDDNQGGSGAGGYRVWINSSSTMNVPQASRGTVAEIKLQAKQNAGSGFTLADLDTPSGTSVTFMVVFQRYPSYVS